MAESRAYCGPPPVPGAGVELWNFDPVLIAALLAATALIVVRRRQIASPAAALGGIAVLAVVFVSPLCALSSALFSVRVLHHVALVALAAPLFASAWPAADVRRLGLALVAATGVFWVWHVPSFYDAAIGDPALYWLMQASLLATATAFWRRVMAVRTQPVATTLAIVASVAQMGLLGAIITFAPRPLYAAHFATTEPWGLNALADQQLAGLAMWVPGMIPYAILIGWVAKRRWMVQAFGA